MGDPKKPEFEVTLSMADIIDRGQLLSQALNLDNGAFPMEERANIVAGCLSKEIVPMLHALTLETEVINFYRGKKSRLQVMMAAKTAKFLGLGELLEQENREIAARQAQNRGDAKQ